MQPSDIDFLKHILQETNYCLSELHSMNRDDLFTNDRLSRALVRSLEIIGEASKKIHPEIKLKYPLIDWFKITGLRNRLIHEYFGIDYDIVWQVLETEIAPLKESIEIIIRNETSVT